MAMKIDDGRTYIDKQEVARRHIHSAVRGTIAGNDPITNRLVIGAALNLMEEYAKGMGKKLPSDMTALVKEEFAKGIAEAMKSPFNYLKHANFDAELWLDVTNLTPANDIMLLLAILDYKTLYSSSTVHMDMFNAAMIMLHPNTLDWDAVEKIAPQMKKIRDGLGESSRDEIMKMMAASAQLLAAERAADEAQLIAEKYTGFYSGDPHRDMFKKAFEGAQPSVVVNAERPDAG